MSLIFKALKKLKDQPAAVVSQDQPAKKDRYIYSFRKIILSPLLVTALALLLVVIVFGLFYSVGYIQRQPVQPPLPAKIPPQRVAKAGPPQHTAEGAYIAKGMPSGGDSVDVPPAPKDFVAAEPSDGGSPEMVTSIERTAPPGLAGPTLDTRADDAKIDQPNSRFLPRNTSSLRVRAQGSQEQSATQKAIDGSGTLSFKEDPVVSQGAASDRPVTSQTEEPEAKPVLRMAATNFIKDVPSGQTRPRAAAKTGQRNVYQKVLREKMSQQANIARLVARIEANMSGPENEETQRLINELEALKGTENAYVLKLKAYWHLRHDDFDAAALLLNRVLQKDAEDLEAGINMAVAEMKTNQLAAAQKRLAKLRDVYPNNTLIPELQQLLR